MSVSIAAFVVLVLVFVIGSVTRLNAGLMSLVAAFIVAPTLAGLEISDVIDGFPSGLLLILVGATLLFGVIRETGTIDLLAQWAERLTGGRKLLAPLLMFLLTAVLATAGAFTPAAVAIVAPVAFALGKRFHISALSMGLVVIQGANAGAFSPVNPFGVMSNLMLDQSGGSDGSLLLYVQSFAFNAVLAVIAYAVVQPLMERRSQRLGHADLAETPADLSPASTSAQSAPDTFDEPSGAVATRTEKKVSIEAEDSDSVRPAHVSITPTRILNLLGLVMLLVLTTVFGLDVGVAAIMIAVVLICLNTSVQKPVIENMPWNVVLLVTGIVTYVNMLERIGALDDLQVGINSLGGASIAALVTTYVMALVSAFASTTATLGVVNPVVVPIAADPSLSSVGVVTAVSVSGAATDASPFSTAGALLMASAPAKQERLFFRTLLVWAFTMIAVVPAISWLIFVQLLG